MSVTWTWPSTRPEWLITNESFNRSSICLVSLKYCYLVHFNIKSLQTKLQLQLKAYISGLVAASELLTLSSLLLENRMKLVLVPVAVAVLLNRFSIPLFYLGHLFFKGTLLFSFLVWAIACTKSKRCAYWFIQLFLRSFHFCCVEVQLDLLNNTNENLNQAPNIKSTSMQVSDPTDSIEEILTKFMFHSIRKFGNFSFLKLSSFQLHSWPSP